MIFKRKFAMNYCKNLKLNLAGMSFSSDFISGKNSNMYPILEQSGEIAEFLSNGHYCLEAVQNGFVKRLIGQYIPYSTARMVVDKLDGGCGFCYTMPNAEVSVLLYCQGNRLLFVKCENGEKTQVITDKRFEKGMAFIVDTRKGAFDLFVEIGDKIEYITYFDSVGFKDAMNYEIFTASTIAMMASGELEISEVSVYMDCGLTQADIRPLRYENGEVMMENGKVYLTMSCRQTVGCYQGVFSWIPGTCEFELIGVLFFDAGDGVWENDVASSILYNRSTAEWYVWVCSFSHGHILGYAPVKGEVRFGVNVIDLKLMEPMKEDDPDTIFLGKVGDEDPDFYFDVSMNKWYMTICRIFSEDGKNNYHYCFFESNHPFEGYSFVSRGTEGSETGGNIVQIEGKLKFVCGSDFDRRAIYHMYDLPDFSKYKLLKCDYDDGGFRGWGTIIPCPCGSRIRYYWLTFDRYRATEATWSYGNLYCFEGIINNKEHDPDKEQKRHPTMGRLDEGI